MRLTLTVFLLVVVGASLGIARTWSEFAGVDERMELPSAVTVEKIGAVASASEPAKQLTNVDGEPQATVVGDLSHDFGVLKTDQERPHVFVVRNDGDADLLIEKQTVSCALCVQTSFTNATVKPGEQIEIPVTLKARKPGPELDEGLEIRTNDRGREVIQFKLIAYVSKAVGTSDPLITLGTLSTDEGGAASFEVYGFGSDELEIIECQANDQSRRDFFDFEIVDLDLDAVKKGQSHAKCGKQINVTIKPGLPVGPLRQSIRIQARSNEEVTNYVELTGQVVGDLSILGERFNQEKSILAIGRVTAGEGKKATVRVMIKGKHRDEIQLSVGECKPAESIIATLGDRIAAQNGKLYFVPLTVEIKKDSPKMNRLGGIGTEMGKVVIKTSHPTAKEVVLYVRFAVE